MLDLPALHRQNAHALSCPDDTKRGAFVRNTHYQIIATEQVGQFCLLGSNKELVLSCFCPFHLMMGSVGGMQDFDQDGMQLRQFDEVGYELSSILGMGDLEGLIYLTLLRTGPITASTLSKEIGLERTKTYRIVERLVSQGIISMTFSNPKMCIPIDPEEAIKSVLRKKNDEIKRIHRVSERVIPRIKGTVNAPFGSNLPTFRIIHGKKSIYSNIEQLLDSSTESVYIVTTLRDVSKMYYSDIPEKVKDCHKRGVGVRLIVDSKTRDTKRLVTRLNIRGAKRGNLPSKGRLAVSKNQMIMSDSGRSISKLGSEVDFALYTNSKEMVNNIFSLCTFVWNTSEDLL